MYIDHQFIPSRVHAAERVPAAPSLLSELERAAVAIGRGDAGRIGWDAFACRSRLWRTTVGRLLRLVGVLPVRPLADQRLELLRIYACMVRRSHPATSVMAVRLEAAGMTRIALLEARAAIEA